MVVPAAVAQRVRLERPYWITLGQAVRKTLQPYCEERHFGFDLRIKQAPSVAEKLESGRYASWSQLEDLVACAVVVPGYSDEASVLQFLRSAFAEVECRQRGSAKKPPDVFRFDSTRFIARLKRQEGLSRPPLVERTQFEVQVRTAFEHAWVVATHPLVYKAPTVDWRRRRLAAQLKAAVEQLDILVQGFAQSAEFIQRSPWPELDEQEKIRRLLVEKFDAKALPEELQPQDWSRLAENIHSLLRGSARSRAGTARQVEKALSILGESLSPDAREAVPLTCSLWQVVAGTLSESGLISSAPEHFVPMITSEMLEFFPAAAVLGTPVDLG